MLSLFRKKSPTLLGIDISSTSVKLLELSQTGNRYRVETFAVGSLARDVVTEKRIADPDKLAETITQVVQQSKTKNRHAAAAMSDSSVITKVVQMNAGLSDVEIENQITYEADKYIPYPLEEVSLDFTNLGETPNHPGSNDILLVASRSENVQEREESFEKSGLLLRVLDVESYAMERAVALLDDQPVPEDDKIIAIFDIGALVTNLTVLSGGVTIFSREEWFGGDELITNIASHYEMPRRDALNALRQKTLPDDFRHALLMPFIDGVVLQVRRALQFFFSASQYSEIHRVVLAGGSANLPGLSDLITDQMGIETVIANPFRHMEIAKQVNAQELEMLAPSLMICCGLALRSFIQDT